MDLIERFHCGKGCFLAIALASEVSAWCRPWLCGSHSPHGCFKAGNLVG